MWSATFISELRASTTLSALTSKSPVLLLCLSCCCFLAGDAVEDSAGVDVVDSIGVVEVEVEVVEVDPKRDTSPVTLPNKLATRVPERS
jgi:hypothetical protein